MTAHDPRPAIRLGDTAAVLEIYPPEWADGVATSPACTIHGATASDDDAAEATLSPAVDTVNLTITTASGYSQANRRRIYLSSTTGIAVGRWYVVANALGQREFVRVVALSASSYVDVETDLKYDYPVTTSTVKGARIAATVDATWVADATKLNSDRLPWRVKWVYTVNSVARTRWTYCDLVRHVGQHSVTEEALYRRAPDLRGQRPTTGTWAEVIEAGWRMLLFDLRVEGAPVNELADAGMLDELTLDAALVVAATNGIVPPGRDTETVVRERREHYSANRARALQSRAIPQTARATGAITQSVAKRVNLWFDS